MRIDWSNCARSDIIDGETRKNSCCKEVLKNIKTKGITHRKAKLRKFRSFETKAINVKEIIKLMFGSESHVRVRKKISNNTTDFSANSGIDFGGLRYTR